MGKVTNTLWDAVRDKDHDLCFRLMLIALLNELETSEDLEIRGFQSYWRLPAPFATHGGWSYQDFTVHMGKRKVRFHAYHGKTNTGKDMFKLSLGHDTGPSAFSYDVPIKVGEDHEKVKEYARNLGDFVRVNINHASADPE